MPMKLSNNYAVIITAGGSGKRMGYKTKKQYLNIAGKPVLFWTLERFLTHGSFSQFIISLPEEDISDLRIQLDEKYPEYEIMLVAGGAERQDSVLNALHACDPETELVFIHDGVRPFVKKSDLDNLLRKMENSQAAILAGKEKNTLKQVKQHTIEKTIPRENIYRAFTPQVFKYKQILDLHTKAKNVAFNFTDDASIFEYFGKPVEVVECGDYNLKLTEPADLKYAEYIIKNDLFKE